MGGHPASEEGKLPHLRRSENERGRKREERKCREGEGSWQGAGTRPGDFPGLQSTCLMLCPISIPLSRKSFQKSPNRLTELILVVGEDGEWER